MIHDPTIEFRKLIGEIVEPLTVEEKFAFYNIVVDRIEELKKQYEQKCTQENSGSSR